MFYYRLFGFNIRSSLEISQLYAIEKPAEIDVDFIFAPVPEEILAEINAQEEAYSFFYGEHHMWFHNRYAKYAIYKDGRIYIQIKPEASLLQCLQFLLGYGIAMFAYYRDMIAIHCGAVCLQDKGVIITGSGGAGKSTLTLDLIENGAKMLSDDVVAVGLKDGIPYLYPAFPQQKLCKDAAIRYGYDTDKLLQIDADKDKYAIKRHDRFESNPQKLHTIYIIHKYEPDAPEYESLNGELYIRPLEGFHKVSAISNQLFLASQLRCMGLPPQQFQICVDIAKTVRIYELFRPADKDTMNEIREFIYKTISEEA